ncbi:MAG: UDP-glucose/GDP-mannose dehydrogenase family protein [Bacteroidales bacterium]|jgi:UDPglucose 6-dehydrogenase|nr:UDP-glucose/GDP-mannose dehydrogenase family protein [Bacteroidales bacterium]
MKIVIVGTGYVGLVTGVCFADVGIDVTCVDIDKTKIDNLKKGISPIYEQGLDELLTKNIQRRTIHFSTDLSESLNDADVVFSAVGTPPDEDGSADLKYVLDVAKTVGKHANKYVLIVTKSTVPVGTAAKVRGAIQSELDARNVKIEFDVASNPEFLKEGSAVKDFMYPERIVVGVESERAEEVMKRLYKPFTLNGHPVIFMDVPSAEMTKYASNAMLAARISFMNDVANLCELVGADVNQVRRGVGSDSRIGSKFLYPGIGYGGSCFPKDVKALVKTAEQNGYTMRVLQSVEEVNEAQKSVLFNKFLKYFNGNIAGKTIAMWGLAFKPGTDDMREAPALVLIDLLTKAGCKVKAFDPVAIEECKRRIGDKIEYTENHYDTLIDADVLFLVTEWTEFRFPDWAKVKNALKTPVIFDGRNIYDKNEMQKEGFDYIGIGFECVKK